jgi:hypothetical protein
MPYEYKDRDGDRLGISQAGGVAAIFEMYGLCRVAAGDFPEVIGEMYKAAGQPAPVILGRPEVSIPANGDPLRCGDLTLRMYEGGISMGLPGVTAAAISPDALRRRAAFMAAYADAVEAGPNRAGADPEAPRPDSPLDGDGKWRPYGGSLLTAERFGRQVRVSFDVANGAASSFPPAKARETAAALVALADEAEAEPDPAEVEALAKAMHIAVCESGTRCVQKPEDDELKRARTAIRWMNARGTADV